MPVRVAKTTCIALAALYLLGSGRAMAGPPELRIWKDRSGRTITAALVRADEGQVRLRREDDKVYSFALDRLSDYDQKYITLGAQEGAVVEVREAVGFGLDQDRAVDSAYNDAIEQVVGVLVVAETVVENDRIVRDRVLTYSEGTVEAHDVLARGSEEGQHRAVIRALVRLDRLRQKLQRDKIPVRDISGQDIARELRRKGTRERTAAEMFRRKMQEFRLDNFLSVALPSAPEIVESSTASAKLRVEVRLTTDLDKWETLRKDLRDRMAELGTYAGSVAVVAAERRTGDQEGWYAWGAQSISRVGRVLDQLRKESKIHDGCLIFLFRSVAPDKPDRRKTEWEIFEMPNEVIPILEELQEYEYHLHLALVDAGGKEILQTANVLAYRNEPLRELRPDKRKGGYWLMPLPTSTGVRWAFRADGGLVEEFVVEVDMQDLQRHPKAAAYLERIRAD